jgi:hypothetical protein
VISLVTNTDLQYYGYKGQLKVIRSYNYKIVKKDNQTIKKIIRSATVNVNKNGNYSNGIIYKNNRVIEKFHTKYISNKKYLGVRSTFDKDGNIIHKVITKYDTYGRKVALLIYKKNNIYSGKNVYKYDKSGNEKTKYWLNDKNIKIHEVVYGYTKDTLVSMKIYDKGKHYATVRYFYNSFNKKIKIDHYYNGTLKSRTRIKYDNRGRITIRDIEIENKKYKDLSGFEKYYYDESSNLAKVIYYTRNNKVRSREILIYDKKNNLIRNTEYDSKNNITGSIVYEYDEYNNCIKEVQFKNGKSKNIIIRQYEYY